MTTEEMATLAMACVCVCVCVCGGGGGGDVPPPAWIGLTLKFHNFYLYIS